MAAGPLRPDEAIVLTSLSLSPSEELRELLADIVPAHRARWGSSNEWDALMDFQRTLGRHGWSAPSWPVELGGRGLDIAEQIACYSEFHRARAPRQVAVFGVNNVGPTIAASGTPEQKLHLGKILTAEEVWCQGFSEPDAGSDLAGLRCRADIDGDGFRINGQKVWTSVGLDATHCMLLVRTDPDAPKHKGISALLMPLDLPGVTRRAIKQINGKAEFAEMFFADVHVPRTALLGGLHDGWRVTMTTLGFERAGVIAIAGLLARDVQELITPERLRDASAVLRQRAVAAYSRSKILGWMGERALADVASDGPGAVASLIKLSWSKLGQEVAELRADLAGMDVIAGLDVEAADELLQSRAATIAGGTTEVMKNLLGERNLGLPREPGRS